ncbi:ADP-ribosylation factor-like protein 9 [Phascolarctos cinereus]|uniref:ADP-ribosylation factor-like protein 9 isoform X1 n=1 Tax=Phascolarctos cinereus TaxID=38626 RepID=A0A6P5JA39_PHACI|nr:ADP-ribosylation factor-like protein 9 isoform X1 [Phascolarctos cinereus]XP_020830951.1 ADP-ribosylation factor-like protein 9 isoform X2 [Phascolarctos cinereus]
MANRSVRVVGLAATAAAMIGGVIYAVWSYVSSPRPTAEPELPRPHLGEPRAASPQMRREKKEMLVVEEKEGESSTSAVPSQKQSQEKAQNKQVLVLGLDGAGKTSVLHTLATNKAQHSIASTQGFNAVCINNGDVQMEFLEIGGSEPFRSYWKMYLSKVLVLIFVVDSADHARLPDAKEQLHQLIQKGPALPLVVFANKQDLEDAYSITDIHEALGLSEIGDDRKLFLFGTHVTKNDTDIPSSMQDARELIAQLVSEAQ